MSFNMSSTINTSSIWKPQKILFYGVSGIGKTTFGSTFERPFLMPIEDGAIAVDIETFRDEYGSPIILRDFEQCLGFLDAVANQQHNLKTLVIDSLDWLERLIWKAVCKRKKLDTIEAMGYGKGYVEASVEWEQVMSWLDYISEARGMDIVILAHSQVKVFTPPDGEAYDRYQIKLHKTASALWQEWADMVLFTNYKRTVMREKQGFDGQRVIAQGKGERVIYTEERPSHLGKNRFNMPYEIYVGGNVAGWIEFHTKFNECSRGRYQIPANIQAFLNNQKS